MTEGRRNNIDFARLESPWLSIKPKKLSFTEYDNIPNCGTSAISLLTGLSMRFVDSFNPIGFGIKYWYFCDIIKFLKSRGFITIEVTKRSVTNSFWCDTPITQNHCVLMLLKMDADEYSVYVMHKGIIWHNFSREKIDALYLLNKPTEQVYVVQHPKHQRKMQQAC